MLKTGEVQILPSKTILHFSERCLKLKTGGKSKRLNFGNLCVLGPQKVYFRGHVVTKIWYFEPIGISVTWHLWLLSDPDISRSKTVSLPWFRGFTTFAALPPAQEVS